MNKFRPVPVENYYYYSFLSHFVSNSPCIGNSFLYSSTSRSSSGRNLIGFSVHEQNPALALPLISQDAHHYRSSLLAKDRRSTCWIGMNGNSVDFWLANQG